MILRDFDLILFKIFDQYHVQLTMDRNKTNSIKLYLQTHKSVSTQSTDLYPLNLHSCIYKAVSTKSKIQKQNKKRVLLPFLLMISTLRKHAYSNIYWKFYHQKLKIFR